MLAIFTIVVSDIDLTNQASPKDDGGVLKAVKSIHSIIDKEVAAGISPENIFICGFSQGGWIP